MPRVQERGRRSTFDFLHFVEMLVRNGPDKELAEGGMGKEH